jgi:CHAD domain-containing protein
VREPGDLWKVRASAVDRARKAARRGEPEGLHDLRVALRRVGATARALGARSLSREARDIVRSLSQERQIQVDRQLLARVGKLGYLSPDAATALAARWEQVAERGARRVVRTADGKEVRGLLKDLDRLSRKRRGDGDVEKLESARQEAEAALAEPLEGKDDDALHRHRIAVKNARYLAEDLATLGVRRFTTQIEREKALQETLGRWNDLRLFARRISESRDEAEQRGSVLLAAELERLLTALEPAIAGLRRTAIEISRSAAKIVPLRRQATRIRGGSA